jgi:hypothetical protein
MGAIHKTLLCQGKTLKMEVHTTLWWLTDNSAVSIIFRKGSGDLTSMRQALQILEFARGLNLDLQPVWVSREDPRLQKADALSKHVNRTTGHSIEGLLIRYGRGWKSSLSTCLRLPRTIRWIGIIATPFPVHALG